MKKRILSIFALLLVVAMCFSLNSCNLTPDNSDDQGAQVPLIPRPEPVPERFAGTPVRYETEEFVAGRQECPWASAGGFIGSFDSKNKSTVSFAVNSSADATVKLIFCIANTASYTIFFEDWNGFLKINNMNYEFDTDDIVHDRNIAKGERYADMYPAFASTAPYLMFEAVEVEIELNKGYNTITFTGGSVTFNFDYIEIIPESDNIRIS